MEEGSELQNLCRVLCLLLRQSLFYHRFDSQKCSSFQLFELQAWYDNFFFVRKIANPTPPEFLL
jgi:hypothetical protein